MLTLNDAFNQGVEKLNLSLSLAQIKALESYLAMIGKWNQIYNLTAVRDPEHMLTHHLLDSLSVILHLQRYLSQVAEPVRPNRYKLLDVGSGAGLPGVVLAIAMPELDVVCVDTVGKKAAFIRQVAAELNLRDNLAIEHARIEHLPPVNADVVTARAFASLSDLCSLTQHHLTSSGVWMAMKGKFPEEEIAALVNIDVFHVEQLQVPGIDADRCLVWLRPRDHKGAHGEAL